METDQTVPVMQVAPLMATEPAASKVIATDIPEAIPVAAPVSAEPAGELEIKWKQKGNEVAPVLEMRAYLDELKEAGVAVGAMKFERDAKGKLTGSFGVSYDTNSAELTKLEGALQGLKKVGNGVEVVEQAEQATMREQRVGQGNKEAVTTAAGQVSEAFGVKQWDALSAMLSQVPKGSLTGPEVTQQTAGNERVKQLAEKQATAKTQVVGEGKSLLDIESAGNPAAAFLKNFYAHLNGAPKTRTSLEVDYEKTRQQLQGRLLAQVEQQVGQQEQQTGQQVSQQQEDKAGPGKQVKVGSPKAKAPKEAKQKPEMSPDATVTTPSVTSAAATEAKTPAAELVKPVVATATAQPQTPKFALSDVPEKVLSSLGLTIEGLEQSGQIKKLLNGEKTDLLSMRVGADNDTQAVKFDGKMVLHREADGTATLKMELPKEKLVIPNEIGGQPFSPEQRKQLETEGTTGLMRDLKDEKGNLYNGYVGIDPRMNKLVILPESKVFFKDEIGGVKLTQAQSEQLREGKAVPLSQLAKGSGKPYDGIAQIMPDKACIMVTPVKEQEQKQQATLKESAEKQEVPKVNAPKEKAKVRGPRL